MQRIHQADARGMVVGVRCRPVPLEGDKVEIPALDGPLARLDGRERSWTDGDGCEPRQRAKAFLRATVDDVKAQIVSGYWHTAKRRDGVYHEQRAKLVGEHDDVFERLTYPRRGLSQYDGDRLHVPRLVCRRP